MFKIYQKEIKTANKEKRPPISINVKGKIGLSRSAYEEFFQGNEFVLLAYDEQEKRLGFKPIAEKQPNSFKISKVVTKQGYVTRHISAKNFFNHFNLSLPVKVTNVYQEDDFLVAELN